MTDDIWLIVSLVVFQIWIIFRIGPHLMTLLSVLVVENILNTFELIFKKYAYFVTVIYFYSFIVFI